MARKICEICCKKYAHKSQLLNHKMEVHDHPGSYTCDICDKKFIQKVSLKHHVKIHNRTKRFKCHRCDFSVDSEKDFIIHENVHQRRDEKHSAMKHPIKCEKCQVLSSDKQALRNHVRKIHPVEISQCDVCGKYLKTKDHLQHHIERHSRA